MPELLIEGVQGSEVAQTGVVHEHVEPAEALRDLLEQRSNAFTVADVELEACPSISCATADHGFGIAVDDHDDGTSFTNVMAVARPIPEPPPVTIATLPSSPFTPRRLPSVLGSGSGQCAQ